MFSGLTSTPHPHKMPCHALILALALTLFAPHAAEAKVIQILHTNDLHASLKTRGAPAGKDPEYGGWAQIKTVMDRLTVEAQNQISEDTPQGIPTLRLDAGDFSEGTLHYFPDHGMNVIRAFQAMGYDAATLGNHDWLSGADNMNRVYGLVPFNKGTKPFPILAANVKISKRMNHLREQIIPTTEMVVNGLKIGIFGLTTNDAFFKWVTKVDSRNRDLKIKSLIKAARAAVKYLRARNDIVIALTHIGYSEDRKLVHHVPGIDLIIGGHSHTLLETYTSEESPDGNLVPIVQTGFNGAYVGKIRLDVDDESNKIKNVYYSLEPVLNSEKKDPTIEALVNHAEEQIQSHFYPKNLEQKIGTAEVRLVPGSEGPTAFAKFVADAMRIETHADVSLDLGGFQGNTSEPAGDVTRRTLMELYPRKFETNQNEGWYIYHASIPGWVIKLGIKYAVGYGVFLSESGITFDVKKMSPEAYKKKVDKENKKESYSSFGSVTPFYPVNMKINGEPIKNMRHYQLAAPEGLIRGAYNINALTHLVIHRGHSVGLTLWDAMESYLSKIGVIKKLDPNEHFSGKEFSNRFQDRRRKGLANEQFIDDTTQAAQTQETLAQETLDGLAPSPEWVADESVQELDRASVFKRFMQDIDHHAETGETDIESEIEAEANQ